MKRNMKALSAAVEALEVRRLFATLEVNGSNGNDNLVFEVDASFIYANMNGLLIPQPVGAWDDVQINLMGGNDTVTIINTGDEPVNIDPGSGVDTVTVSSDSHDLDHINARVFMAAGSDSAIDFLNIRDDDDTGSDEYDVYEPASSPMRLRKLASGVAGPDKVHWGESNIHAIIWMNDFDNDATVASSVSMAGASERLSFTGGEVISGLSGGSGGDDTLTVSGSISGDNSFIYFHGGSGDDVMNVNTNSIGSGLPLFEFFGGTGFTDTINITDPNPTTRYTFQSNHFVKFFEGTTQTAEFEAATDLINLNSTHATQGAVYEAISLNDDTDIAITAGAGDDSLIIGDNFITTDFGPAVNIDFTGGTGADSVEILDGSYNDERDHIFSGTTYDSDFLGVLTMSSVSDFVLFAGDGGNDIDVGGLILQTLELNGGTGSDVFTITPNLITNIEANGSSPFVAPGDVLFIDVGSATDGTFTANGASGGTYDYDARSPIVFTGMEQFPTPTTITPAVPNLATADDTGTSSTDNITNLTTLDFTGSGAPSGHTAKLFRGNTEVATAVPASGNYTFANVTFPTGDATFQMTTRYINNTTQLLSPVSPALTLRVDTIAPSNPSAAPDLSAASDSGLSSTDNITNDVTPTFTGTSPADAIVNLFDGATEIASETDLVANYSITSPSMSEGSRNMTVRFEDVAGNLSSASGALVMTIDTIAPAAPVATDLDTASDTGFSSTDNVTFDKTPTFTGTSPVNQVVRVFNGTTLIGSETDLVAGYSITASGGVSDGSHQITARMEDIAGNQSAASPVLGILIDTAAPATPSAPRSGFRQRHRRFANRQHHARQHAQLQRVQQPEHHGSHFLVNE